MKVIDGPLDGSDLPDRTEQFCMVTFYTGRNTEIASVAVYLNTADGWLYQHEATRQAQSSVRGEAPA